MRGRILPPLLAMAVFLGCQAASAEEVWKFGPGLKWKKKGEFEIGLSGYGQLDFGSFLNWEPGDPEQGLANDDFDVPRLRIGIDGEWRRLSFEFQGEFGDLVNFEEDVDVDRLRDAWLDLRFAKALRLRVGNQKVPVSPEWLTSARRIDLVLRSLIAGSLAPNRDWGVLFHGDIGTWIEYQAGVFEGDGRARRERAETTAAVRVVIRPAESLAFGASFSQGDVAADPEGPGAQPEPKGIEGQAFSGFEFFHRKFVNGQRRRIGAEVSWVGGPVALKSEFLRMREERLGQGATFEDLPALVGTGWAVSATWLVTGEKKKTGITPRRPLGRGPGALELAVRYDDLRFDDDGPAAGFAGVGDRSRNVRPAQDQAVTGGLSWWPIGGVRLMTDIVIERFLDPLVAPKPGRQGNYVTLLARLQLELP